MVHDIVERRRVYLACRAIFAGDKALLRKAKKVREEIEKRPTVLASLKGSLGIEKVVEILRDLLERRIFESELKAKVEFPDLFHSSPKQEAKRETSEIDAAKSTAEALEEIASAQHSDTEIDGGLGDIDHVEQAAPNQRATLPSLYPTYIPYKAQHLILNEAQRMLEECCFDFVQNWAPVVLEDQGLDCASSIELTRWTRLLAKIAENIPQEAFNLGVTPLTEVLFATNSLRHSAVHRLQTTARGIQDLVKSAIALTFALNDHRRAGQLEAMSYELDSKIKAMELNKNVLENLTKAGLEDIQRRREELDRMETAIIANMIRDDRENKNLIGVLLEDTVYVTDVDASKRDDQHDTLKYHLLGPSLTKAGQDSVDQSKVSEVIYNASKGSKYFNREEVKDKILTQKIEQIVEKKRRLEKVDLTRELRAADQLVAQLELTRDLTQYIVHVDCDAFYAAVEQLDRPEIKDLPFAVGGGVLTTCNYVARKFGCRSGMAGFVAKKLCPSLILLPLNFDKYTSKAQEVRGVLAQYDPRFESASIDEAYLNITEYCVEHDMTPEDVVQQMRDEIHEATKITVSAGIAANAKLAKICVSNMNKPNGQYCLPSDRNAIMTFMRDLPTRKVNGIGRVLERELQEIGIKTCGDIYTHRQFLRQLFGDKTYEFLIMCHLGLGRTEVQPAEEYERKSVGTESTFRDMSDPTQLREKLRWTAEELERDMRRAECKGRTLVLKVKLHTYEVLTRQAVTPRAICAADDLYNYALPILTKLEQEIPGMKLRLMGLRCTHLVSTKKPDARAFFGLRPLKMKSEVDGSDGTSKEEASRAIQEEAIPPGLLGHADGHFHPGGTGMEGHQASMDGSYRHHGKEVVPNPKRGAPTEEPEEWWDCPICSRPQATDERLFNDHIDLCLSRQTIRDAVQDDNVRRPTSALDTPAPKRLKTGGEKKRGRALAPADPKQTKLFFG
ncbi:hypothetical protein GGR53DRAFT_522566 [Hypoxylon sp. FL1150]|nr:hypothetical protein GGR53DRAFT_522566 [Hypoxylon sp. FL1150]